MFSVNNCKFDVEKVKKPYCLNDAVILYRLYTKLITNNIKIVVFIFTELSNCYDFIQRNKLYEYLCVAKKRSTIILVHTNDIIKSMPLPENVKIKKITDEDKDKIFYRLGAENINDELIYNRSVDADNIYSHVAKFCTGILPYEIIYAFDFDDLLDTPVNYTYNTNTNYFEYSHSNSHIRTVDDMNYIYYNFTPVHFHNFTNDTSYNAIRRYNHDTNIRREEPLRIEESTRVVVMEDGSDNLKFAECLVDDTTDATHDTTHYNTAIIILCNNEKIITTDDKIILHRNKKTKKFLK